MRQVSRRFTGWMLVSTAVLGLLISLIGVVGIWWVRPPLTRALTSSTRLAIGALETTSQGLTVVAQALDLADSSVARLEEAFTTLVTSLGDTVDVLDTLVTLSGRGLPATVQAAQVSLRAAQTSAQVLEGMLYAVTSIPFFPGQPYNPEKPLHQALGEVATSLEGLNTSFTTLETSLEQTGSNLGLIKTEIKHMQEDIQHIRESLQGARDVVRQYQDTAARLLERLHWLEVNLPRLTTLAAIGLTIFLIWLGFNQVAMLSQGLEWLRRDPSIPDA
ncbi:hypothetical protein QYE77_07280 [Thermanaerothrix sp. 4228-RoL]|uniref:Uncharacterized protein n=2 Tax=Thermanaerothrix TaxID=1077886 RepID=A0ABU3NMK1_9CHLR|nr:hypothetical protein [Thermanaerothrix sp. 4228-RoL]MDT8898069.1 hypothetical protein [Thermanaerothrix sp. 4228-RoL]